MVIVFDAYGGCTCSSTPNPLVWQMNFDLSTNYLQALSHGMGSLRSLTTLNLAGNFLSELPPTLVSLLTSIFSFELHLVALYSHYPTVILS